jgi:hypothetical protein
MIFHQYFRRETYSTKTFAVKNVYQIFSKVTIFEEMILQQQNFDQNYWTKQWIIVLCIKIFDQWEIDLTRIKKFRPKLLIKIMGNCTLYYDFPLVFQKRNILKKNPHKLWKFIQMRKLRKWFCNIKKFRPKLKTKIMENNLYYDFWTVFLKRNIFQEKHFHQKILWKFYHGYLSLRKWFCKIKNFGQKYWSK